MSRRFEIRGEGTGPLLDINTTPLIDVLLVLIIMLIITIPPRLHQLDLGVTRAVATQAQAGGAVQLVLQADGALQWQGQALNDVAELDQRLAQLAAAPVPAQLQLMPHPKVAYRHVTAVLAAARRHGLRNLAVVGP